jgi:hypothetical protein
VIEKIDSMMGPAIKRFFTRIPDFSNFPASTGFLVMTIKRTLGEWYIKYIGIRYLGSETSLINFSYSKQAHKRGREYLIK